MAQVSLALCHHSPHGDLSLIGLSMKERPNKLHRKAWDPSPIVSPCRSTAGPIREPRGAGNLRGEDIEKISQVEGITSSIKRIDAIADILDHEIIETEETLQNQSPERAKYFKNTLMVTGVNDSSKEDKFVSGAYKLVQGEHLTDKDKINPHARRFGEKEWPQGRR